MAEVFGPGMDFSAYMEESDHEHRVIKASSYTQDVIDYYHAQKEPAGVPMPFHKAAGNIRFRPGETSIWAGTNGHGKSLLLGQIMTCFAARGQKACIASMEMKPMVTLARMCRQAFGSHKPEIEFIRDFHRITDGKLWLYDQQGMVRPEMILAVARYCADRLKINHFVIDSLMKCGIGEDDYNKQKWFLDSITTIGRDTGMHMHLVAHSRKGKDELAPPNKMDIKGTGSITDQVDNVFTVWRNKKKEGEIADSNPNDISKINDLRKAPDALVICDKQRNGEWEGKVGLWYHGESMQYLEDGLGGPMRLLGMR